jgi:EAL domain-containing protein (putative c-di-GMP-specific phosphodiesterase class I)
LKRLPLDTLKIDQSFVRGLPDDPYDVALSTAIIGMGKALDLTVIAEGVETEEQLRTLRGIDCSAIQGFFLSRPLPPAEYARFAMEPKRLAA